MIYDKRMSTTKTDDGEMLGSSTGIVYGSAMSEKNKIPLLTRVQRAF